MEPQEITTAEIHFIWDWYHYTKSAHDALVWLHLTSSSFAENGEDRADTFTGVCPYDGHDCAKCAQIAILAEDLDSYSADLEALRAVGRVSYEHAAPEPAPIYTPTWDAKLDAWACSCAGWAASYAFNGRY